MTKAQKKACPELDRQTREWIDRERLVMHKDAKACIEEVEAAIRSPSEVTFIVRVISYIAFMASQNGRLDVQGTLDKTVFWIVMSHIAKTRKEFKNL